MKSKNSRKIIVHILLLLGITITVFPFVWMILTSFKTVGEAMQIPPTIFPKKFLTDAYSSIVTALPFGRVYLNTIISTVVTTVVQVLFCSMAAYAFARIEFPFKNAIFVLVLSVLMVPGQIFLIPQYRIVQSLGLLDSMWALILPGAISVYNMVIARTYFQNSIPGEMLESARLDGCDDWKILINMILPLSKSIIAVLVLYYAVSHWNSYFDAFIYLSSESKFTLQVVLRNIMSSVKALEEMTTTVDQSVRAANIEVLKYAVIVFGSIPLIVLYPFVQKHFVKGVMIGSVKG